MFCAFISARFHKNKMFAKPFHQECELSTIRCRICFIFQSKTENKSSHFTCMKRMNLFPMEFVMKIVPKRIEVERQVNRLFNKWKLHKFTFDHHLYICPNKSNGCFQVTEQRTPSHIYIQWMWAKYSVWIANRKCFNNENMKQQQPQTRNDHLNRILRNSNEY